MALWNRKGYWKGKGGKGGWGWFPTILGSISSIRGGNENYTEKEAVTEARTGDEEASVKGWFARSCQRGFESLLLSFGRRETRGERKKPWRDPKTAAKGDGRNPR